MATSSSELQTLIERVEKTDQYRWWRTEITDLVELHNPERSDLIEFFRRENLWYKDEILARLNQDYTST